MTEKEKMRKVKKSLTFRLLLCLLLAAVLIVPVLLTGVTKREEKEGYAVLDIDTLPIQMVQNANGEKRFYYVSAVDGQMYLARLSDETFGEICDMLDVESGKLREVYQLKGIEVLIGEDLKRGAIANSFKVFLNREVTDENFSEYFAEYYIEDDFVSERTVNADLSLVFAGMFFLVLAFGYLTPALLKANKGDFGLRDDKKMKRALGQYLPVGEYLTAGVYVDGLQTKIVRIFGKCELIDEELVPNENAGTLLIAKSKYSTHELYIGMTEKYLVFAECEKYKHAYEYGALDGYEAKALECRMPLSSVGRNAFLLTSIETCKIKHILLGCDICTVSFLDGSLLKFKINRSAGYGMSHHKENREAIINRLQTYEMGE